MYTKISPSNKNHIIQTILIFITCFLVLLSCDKPSEISKNFNCNQKKHTDLETIEDAKKTFTIALPKSWNTNLYVNEIQSSIYSADTTKQLTASFLLDITAINKKITLNDAFKLKKEHENLTKNLIKVKSGETTLINYPTYYTVSRGKKKGFNYKVCHFFIKLNDEKFIIAKAEIFGNKDVDIRICNAISLIEKLRIIK